MSLPYSGNYGSASSFTSIDLTTFITGTTNPTATSASYAKYQKYGNRVTVRFKYIFATVGTGSYVLNMPVAVSSSFPKVTGFLTIRYSGTGATHLGYLNDGSGTTITPVFSTTFGGVPNAFTNTNPNSTLATNDILSGEFSYEC